jgi:septal ring factor EnvC (AmiA/AmiB activator)
MDKFKTEMNRLMEGLFKKQDEKTKKHGDTIKNIEKNMNELENEQLIPLEKKLQNLESWLDQKKSQLDKVLGE